MEPETVKKPMLGMGLDEWISTMMRNYSKACSEGCGDFVPDRVERITGHSHATSSSLFVKS